MRGIARANNLHLAKLHSFGNKVSFRVQNKIFKSLLPRQNFGEIFWIDVKFIDYIFKKWIHHHQFPNLSRFWKQSRWVTFDFAASNWKRCEMKSYWYKAHWLQFSRLIINYCDVEWVLLINKSFIFSKIEYKILPKCSFISQLTEKSALDSFYLSSFRGMNHSSRRRG